MTTPRGTSPLQAKDAVRDLVLSNWGVIFTNAMGVEILACEVILPPVPDPKVRGPENLYQHSRNRDVRWKRIIISDKEIRTGEGDSVSTFLCYLSHWLIIIK